MSESSYKLYYCKAHYLILQERQADQLANDRTAKESDAVHPGPGVEEEVEADSEADEAASEGEIDDSVENRVDVIVVPSSSDALHFVGDPRSVIVASSSEMLGMRIRTATVYGIADMSDDQRHWLMRELHRWVLSMGGKIVYEPNERWVTRRWATRPK